MKLEDLRKVLKDDLGFEIYETEYDGILWTLEEHCYTACPDGTEVFDSEGELPEGVSTNLEAIRWYFEYELLKLRTESVLYDED
jgi:hypothetical protein